VTHRPRPGRHGRRPSRRPSPWSCCSRRSPRWHTAPSSPSAPRTTRRCTPASGEAAVSQLLRPRWVDLPLRLERPAGWRGV